MCATMIPTEPLFIPDGSMEDKMFYALSKLPDDYYVFHSFRTIEVKNNILEEHETDFIVFNQKLGLLCIEAKAGEVYFDGQWKYQYGNPMHGLGPFVQAENNKFNLLHLAQINKQINNLLYRCKFSFCVWFPSISKERLDTMLFPRDASKELVLTTDDLLKPSILQKNIQRICSYKIGSSSIETILSDVEAKTIINNFLCPKMNVVSTGKFELESKKYRFHQLLKEQLVILNYLEEMESVAINGAAGTGKTLIAVEKARRLSLNGDKVLFLCINKELQSFLASTYPYDFVTYMTLSSYTKEITGSYDDYEGLLEYLYNTYGDKETLIYKHVIVDEGQDFGIYAEDSDYDDCKVDKTKQEILKAIRDNLIDNEFGCFYIFYDEFQLIQASDIPEVIKTADCKLTLFKNCRNTQNIATASIKSVNLNSTVTKNKRKLKLMEGALPGDMSRIHYCQITNSNEENFIIKDIDDCISFYKAKGIQTNEIVILTCKTLKSSILNKLNVINNNYYVSKKHKDIKISTCRKFKGLESLVVILVDVTKENYSNDIDTKIYYVGASRAKLNLEIITLFSEKECEKILSGTFGIPLPINNPKKQLAITLGCIQYHR